MKTLTDKTAIITGASSGIDRATALLFAAEGAKVIVNARRKHELDTLVRQIERTGGAALAVGGGVREESVHEVMVRAATEHFGELDIAFNNAGGLGEMGSTVSISRARLAGAIDTNLTSGFLAARHQVPALLASPAGSLIFTSAVVGHTSACRTWPLIPPAKPDSSDSLNRSPQNTDRRDCPSTPSCQVVSTR